MKFFSEFGSCWGGAAVNPAADVAGGGRWMEAEGGNRRKHCQATSKRQAKLRSNGGSVNHWKPKLSAISEDSPMSEVDRGGARLLVGSHGGKRPVKVKTTSLAKAATPPSHEEDYWKYSYAMAMPAFSPSSFLF